MANTILGIGNKIELKALKWKNPDETPPVYVSQLLDFDEESDEILIIAMPIYEGHLVPLEVGKRFEACFSASKGLYKADCTVLSRVKKNNIYMVEIQLDTQLKKFQRREYFRLNCSVEVNFRMMDEQERTDYLMSRQLKEEYSAPVQLGTVIDMSGGGVRMICDSECQSGDCMVIHLFLPDSKRSISMDVAGTVISCERMENQHSKYDVRIQFVFEEKEQQERIIKYIFEEQRRRMKSNSLN